MVKGLKHIFQIFIDLLKGDIIKVFSYTAMSTLVRMLTAFITIKIIAVVIGPTGIALIGQLNNFTTIIMTLACGGINTGITKYVSEYKKSESDIKKLISTAFRITLACSFSCGLFMIICHSYLSKLIMLDTKYGYVFIVFGATVFLYALNMLFASIMDGYKEFKKYVAVSITGSFLGLLFTLTLVLTSGLSGALIGAVTFQSVMLFVTIFMIKRLKWFNLEYFKARFDSIFAKKYFQYALMTLVSAGTGPVSQLILRGHVISHISATEAGWWEAMNRISNMYLMVITTSFSIYYLPRLSEINNNNELRKEIFKAYKVIAPLLFIGFSAVYFLRLLIIKVLFTPDFFPMENLFLWQLIGDFFKICSWLLAFLMVAKAMTKTYIATEIIFSLGFVIVAFIFMKLNGLVGITQGLAVIYLLYLLFMVFIFRKLIFSQDEIEI
jgi:O-antigen/teichoic acid export membrane protein